MSDHAYGAMSPVLTSFRRGRETRLQQVVLVSNGSIDVVAQARPSKPWAAAILAAGGRDKLLTKSNIAANRVGWPRSKGGNHSRCSPHFGSRAKSGCRVLPAEVGSREIETTKGYMMKIFVPPDLERVLAARAHEVGTTPELLALDRLRDRFPTLEPEDEDEPNGEQRTLADLLDGYVGVLQSSQWVR